MKKLFSILLVALMILTVALPAFAVDFVPSKERTSTTGTEDYFFFDENGAPISNLYLEDNIELIITDILEKDQALLPEIKDMLENSEKQLAATPSLDKLVPGFNAAFEAEKKVSQDPVAKLLNLDDLVIYDLFDASLVRNRAELVHLKPGDSITFTVKTDITLNDFLMVLHNVEGTNWIVQEDWELDEKGNLTITTDTLSTFTLVVNGSPKGPDSPQTGFDAFGVFTILFAGIACVGTGLVFFARAQKA